MKCSAEFAGVSQKLVIHENSGAVRLDVNFEFRRYDRHDGVWSSVHFDGNR